MIRENTVLVLGAGASRPYKFPTGGELRSLLLQRDEPKELLANMGFADDPMGNGKAYYGNWLDKRLQAHHVERHELEQFQQIFDLSQLYSIDAFIAANPFYKTLGSLLVAAILLRCEKEAKLFGDWYQLIFNELVGESKDFSPTTLSVITFNYDRSLEYYLYRAFKNSFELTQNEAWSMVERIKIIHVYGQLGPLSCNDPRLVISYGNDGGMGRASEQIQLMQPRYESAKAQEIQSLLATAQQISFLGFGFDSTNLDAMGITMDRPFQKPVHATCYKLSQVKMSRADARFTNRIKWGDRNHTVAEFLHNTHALY